MKRLLTLVLAISLCLSSAAYVFAGTAPLLTSAVTGSVSTLFSVVFYPRTSIDKPDANIQFPTGQVAFGPIDPSLTLVYPTGRIVGDQKSDVGILMLCNTGEAWGLKVHQSGTANPENLAVYIPSNAYNRNVEPAEVLGGMAFAKGWYRVQKTPTTIYTADSTHRNTVAWGTLVTLSYAIVPSGKADLRNVSPDPVGGENFNGNPLPSGALNIVVVYTMTTSL